MAVRPCSYVVISWFNVTLAPFPASTSDRFDDDLKAILPWSKSAWSHTDLQRLKRGRISAQVSSLCSSQCISSFDLKYSFEAYRKYTISLIFLFCCLILFPLRSWFLINHAIRAVSVQSAPPPPFVRFFRQKTFHSISPKPQLFPMTLEAVHKWKRYSKRDPSRGVWVFFFSLSLVRANRFLLLVFFCPFWAFPVVLLDYIVASSDGWSTVSSGKRERKTNSWYRRKAHVNTEHSFPPWENWIFSSICQRVAERVV